MPIRAILVAIAVDGGQVRVRAKLRSCKRAETDCCAFAQTYGRARGFAQGHAFGIRNSIAIKRSQSQPARDLAFFVAAWGGLDSQRDPRFHILLRTISPNAVPADILFGNFNLCVSLFFAFLFFFSLSHNGISANPLVPSSSSSSYASYVVCVYESAKQAATSSSTALNGRFGLTPFFLFLLAHTANVLLASA